MIEPIQINHDESKNLLIEQYKNADNLKSILSAKSAQANSLEQAIFEVRDLIYLDTATGKQLDILGKIWDVPRMGMADEQYRDAIQRKIALKISGTIPEIINILKSLYSATYVEYYSQYPAKYLLITDANITQSELEAISPAGVGVIYKKVDQDETYFVFQDNSFCITETIEFLGPEV